MLLILRSLFLRDGGIKKLSVKGRRGEIEKVLHFELLYFFFYRFSLRKLSIMYRDFSSTARCDASVFTLGWHWIAIIMVVPFAGRPLDDAADRQTPQ